MRVEYRIGTPSPVALLPLAQSRRVTVAPRARTRHSGRLPALGMTAALLFAAAGCASLDPVGSKAWRIDPVLDVKQSAIAAHGYHAVGRYHDGMGAWDKAAAAYRRATEADPRHAEAHNGLAVALARLGRHDEAELALRRAIQIEPQRAHLRSNLGLMLLKAGRLDEALVELKAAVKLDPQDATALGKLREAVALRESAQMGENHAATAQPAPPAAAAAPAQVLPAAAILAAPVVADTAQAQIISVPAPITTASVAAPLGNVVGVFDQPTVPAWPLAARPAPNSFEAMAGTGPSGGAADRHQPATRPAQAAGAAVAMPVRLSALSMPVALVAPRAIGAGLAPWSTATRLELSNGNGVRGMAARLGKWLASEGMKASRLTNLRPFGQEHTIVEYRSGQEAAAWQVMQALPVATQADPVLRQGLQADVRVVLGKDWLHACIDRSACSPAGVTVAARGEAR